MSEQYIDWNVGDKIVFFRKKSSDSLLKTGNVYTIREILPYTFSEGKAIGVRLNEVVRFPNDERPTWNDAPYNAKLFRKVIDTDGETQFEKLKKLTDKVFTQKELVKL